MIIKQPKILTIIMNRTNMNDNYKDSREIRINKELDYLELNLTEYVYKSVFSNEYISDIKNNEFFLYGTINHFGGKFGGHYLA